MDFSGMVRWGIRITVAVSLVAAFMFILSAISLPAVPAAAFLDGFDTIISIFYYYVPAATFLFPLMTAMWALSFVILTTKFAIIGLRTLNKTSQG